MEPVRVERIDERSRDVGLPDELLEVARTPLAGKHLIAHGVLRSVADGVTAMLRKITDWVRWRATGQRELESRLEPSFSTRNRGAIVP